MINKHIERMFNGRHFANCRNYCDWAFGANPKVFNPDNMPEAYRCYAISTFRTGDILSAKPMLERLLKMPAYAYDSELLQMLDAASSAKPSRIEILCANESITPEIERLLGIIRRHTYVFSAINKRIGVYIPENEAAYERFFLKIFPNRPLFSYNYFMACGFYYDPERLWLVIHPQHIALDIPDLALEGMIAHEMAHFQLNASGASKAFWGEDRWTNVDLMLNDRLTDLCAIGYGFAYPLYCSRKHFKSSKYVITESEIISYLDKLQKD